MTEIFESLGKVAGIRRKGRSLSVNSTEEVTSTSESEQALKSSST